MFEVTARLKIRDGELDGFKEQAAEMMRQTREKDARTLRYDWFLSDDGTQCEVREGYVDADALIEHARNVADARDNLFREFAYDHNMTLYGEPSPALAELIERLSGVVPFARFSLLQALDVDTDGSSISANRQLLDVYVERYNAGNLDGVMDLYAEDAVQNMPDGRFEGRRAIRERLARELSGFTDVNHAVRSFVEQGDSFCDEWTFAGTHTRPFLLPDGTQLSPTGKRVEIAGMELVQVRNGKVVVNTLYYDNLAVAAQLGVAPVGAAA
jgi:predicted ester cyclase/quinol monooxygenase YgiN